MPSSTTRTATSTAASFCIVTSYKLEHILEPLRFESAFTPPSLKLPRLFRLWDPSITVDVPPQHASCRSSDRGIGVARGLRKGRYGGLAQAAEGFQKGLGGVGIRLFGVHRGQSLCAFSRFV